VLVLTKDTIDQSNTWYAQGGIAAVLQPADSYESHVTDTKKAARDYAIMRRSKCHQGRAQRVLELLEWGANFDKKAAMRTAWRSHLKAAIPSRAFCTPLAMRLAASWRRR